MTREEELEQLIYFHKNLYYKGEPEISDDEFDLLEDELKSINKNNPALRLVGSIVKSNNKIKHSKKMLSLNKTYDHEDLLSWTDGNEVVFTYKVDGVSCSLIYENGLLKLAKTRGNGSFGEDITEKVRWIKDIPQKIAIKEEVEVRGEIFCFEKKFHQLVIDMEKLGLDKPTSLRNSVAGLLGRKDHVFLNQHLSFFSFDIFGKESLVEREIQKEKILAKNNFLIPSFKLLKNKKEILKSIDDTEKFMMEGDYQIDGAVYTINNIATQEELGFTAHHPRFKMAFKFKGISKTTTINEIFWSLSRNGVLTPVAKVKPVELSGAMISNVTLHNYGLVRDFNLKKDDQIEIIRSGEVIPKFVSVISSSKSMFEIPSKCPSCESKLRIEDIWLLCKNINCPEKIKQEILYFIKKIGIDDVSDKRLDEMIRKEIVKEIPDLFSITEEHLLSLDKTKEKLAQKILLNISKVKKIDLVKFLGALGITGGGSNKIEKIALSGFNTIEKILNLKEEQLIEIDGFAEKSANDFCKSLNEKKPLIDKLIKVGFNILPIEVEEVSDSKIAGKSFCITGTLSVKRSVLEKKVKKFGGKVSSSVTSKTDYLITNDKVSNSSKFKKAQSLNIPILSESDFDKLIS